LKSHEFESIDTPRRACRLTNDQSDTHPKACVVLDLVKQSEDCL